MPRFNTSFCHGSASQYGLKLRTGTNGEETLVGHDVRAAEVFVDRSHSEQIGFDPTFSGHYVAPLALGPTGCVTLRVLVDRSSVEVFAGEGEAVLTAQIFPRPTSIGVAVFASGGFANLAVARAWPVNSAWHP